MGIAVVSAWGDPCLKGKRQSVAGDSSTPNRSKSGDALPELGGPHAETEAMPVPGAYLTNMPAPRDQPQPFAIVTNAFWSVSINALALPLAAEIGSPSRTSSQMSK